MFLFNLMWSISKKMFITINYPECHQSVWLVELMGSNGVVSFSCRCCKLVPLHWDNAVDTHTHTHTHGKRPAICLHGQGTSLWQWQTRASDQISPHPSHVLLVSSPPFFQELKGRMSDGSSSQPCFYPTADGPLLLPHGNTHVTHRTKLEQGAEEQRRITNRRLD